MKYERHLVEKAYTLIVDESHYSYEDDHVSESMYRKMLFADYVLWMLPSGFQTEEDVKLRKKLVKSYLMILSVQTHNEDRKRLKALHKRAKVIGINEALQEMIDDI